MNSILDAQRDMRIAYYRGVPGVISSGLVWLVAGVVAILVSSKVGVITLVIGGMFIFPASIILCKVFGARGKHEKGNPLAAFALEGTFWMLLSIPVSVGIAFYKLEWFFPSMMLIIGGRYLTFSTLYGMRVYWVFGAALAISSVALLSFNASTFLSALVGACVELVFAFLIFVRSQAE